MIKFETINGTLCRMVEPTPLQPDSPMPCVVRYIQDCSPMGRYMKRKYAMVINTVAIVSRIGTDGRAYSSDKIFVEEVEVLEIIGYPVVDGSAEWALYQMQNGKTVCNKNNHAVMFANEKSVSPFWYETWEQTISLYPNGWEIYEEPDHIDALDSETRELVESRLKAQEDK
jgi:hypothetical protein